MRLVVNILAAYRLLRLVQIDSITRPWREWFWRVTQPRPRLRYWRPLLACPWCASIWIAGGVLAMNAWGGVFWWLVARMLALAAIVGFLGWLDHQHIG